jgi:hypothetical protein
MITLNQIISNLNQIANAHYQINSFGSGSVVEFATSGITNYPAMWVDHEPSQVQGNAYLHVLKIYVMDRLIKGKKNELELFSDIQQICLDIIAQLNSSIYGWKLVNDNFTLSPFSEPKFDDEDSGYYFDVQLKVPFTYDRCQIPFNQSIVNTGTSLKVTILDQNGNVVTTLSPGETYTVLSVDTIDGGSSSTIYSNQIIQA